MKKLALVLIVGAFVSVMTGCSKSSSTAASGGGVTAVATPGTVSVVTAK